MNKFKFSVLFFGILLLGLSTITLAQSQKWSDLGLTQELLSSLTEEEFNDFLTSFEPQTTRDYIIKTIEEEGLEGIDDKIFDSSTYAANTESNIPAPVYDENLDSCINVNKENVDFKLDVNKSFLYAGDTANFTIALSNNSKTDIKGGNVIVKVFKVNDDNQSQIENLVGMFSGANQIDVRIGEQYATDFNWTAPQLIESGNYVVVTSLYLDNGNLTPQIISENRISLGIEGVDTSIKFIPNELKVNDFPYDYQPNVFNVEDTKLSVAIPVLNNTDENKEIKIKWKLHKNTLASSSVIKEFDTVVSVDANSQNTATIDIDATENPFQYVVIEIEEDGVKSIVDFIILKKNTNLPTLIQTFFNEDSIVKNNENNIVVCYQNIGSNFENAEIKIITEILDSKGGLVERFEINNLNQDYGVAKNSFVSDKTLKNFAIKTQILVNNKIVDQSTMTYTEKPSQKNSMLNIVLFVLGGGLIVALLVFLLKKMKGKVVLFSLALLFCLGNYQSAQAQASNTATLTGVSAGQSISQYPAWYQRIGQVWSSTSVSGKADVDLIYTLKITDTKNNVVLNNGASIEKGASLKVELTSDINWGGTVLSHPQNTSYIGANSGGELIANAAAPANNCSSTGGYIQRWVIDSCSINAYSSLCSGQHLGMEYIRASVNPPTRTTTLTNLTCGTMSTAGVMTCTANQTGPVAINMSFSSTYARMYSSVYHEYNGDFTGVEGCKGTGPFTPDITLNQTQAINFTGTAFNAVTFNANGGSGTMASQTFSTNETKPLSANTFTRNGYAFAGWATTATGPVVYANQANYTMGSANVTLYAKWTQVYTITFNKNSGSGTNMPNQTFFANEPKPLSANTYTRSGYIFAGWATTASGPVAYADQASYTMGTANVTLYAKWTASYTVTFDKNHTSATGTMAPQGFLANEPKLLSANTYTRPGYTFVGWATTSTGSVVYVDQANYTMGTASVTLYAKWTASYTVTFDKNDASATGTMAPQAFLANEPKPLSANAFSRTGYTFSGWATTASGPVAYANQANYTMGTASVTLYAKWSLINMYTLDVSVTGLGSITSNPAGINNCTSNCSSSYASGTLVTVTATPDTGNTFTGWGGPVCSGTGVCGVSMTTNRSVTANFIPTANLPVSIDTFEFETNIANLINSTTGCQLNLSASNTTSCTLTNRVNQTRSFSADLLNTISIDISDNQILSIGTYTLTCSDLGGIIYTHPSTISCKANPSLREF